MSNDHVQNLSRRGFLKTSLGAGVGLTLGVWLPSQADTPSDRPRLAGPGMAGGADAVSGSFTPNAFVRIGTDDSVTVICKHLEMGQGTYTGLPTLVAEELDASWEQVRAEGAPANASRYNNLFWGPVQGTGGSTAIANSFEQLRKAGAAARHMLVAAAAEQWQVPAAEITVRDGIVSHAGSGRQSGFGALAEAAASQPVPEQPKLKDPSEFRLIGNARLPRKDSAAKCNGSALFTQDVRLPNMLTAVVAHPPLFGASVRGFDDSAALAIPASNRWCRSPAASRCWASTSGAPSRAATRWSSTGTTAARSSRARTRSWRTIASSPSNPASPRVAMATSTRPWRRRAPSSRPNTACPTLHMRPWNRWTASMEPTADGGVRVINGEQFQTIDQQAVAGVLGIAPEQVQIEMLYAGGSFGRRANPGSDYLIETAHILKASGGKQPVKLAWTREDDTRAGWYRPLYLHRLKAGLDADGKPIAWQQRIVGQSIIAGTAFERR